MDKETCRKRKKRRKRRRLKRIVIAYLLRVLVVLVPLMMIILMVCGCLYIYEKFTDKEEEVIETAPSQIPAATIKDNGPQFRVVIDPGHGGSDGGTVSGGTIEKDINLSVALKLKAVLEDDDIDVVMTRSSDEYLSLEQRATAANDAGADFFISLHCNYYEEDARIAGLECYYSSPDATESKAYAESIVEAVSLSDGMKARTAKDEGYYVLLNTRMPAVLVEMGFLSNDSERRKLADDDYQETLSQKIAEGILREGMD
nr:N-acetylmuramoyl-L-alanine amidase [uncultured Acetatifactor sp.]